MIQNWNKFLLFFFLNIPKRKTDTFVFLKYSYNSQLFETKNYKPTKNIILAKDTDIKCSAVLINFFAQFHCFLFVVLCLASQHVSYFGFISFLYKISSFCKIFIRSNKSFFLVLISFSYPFVPIQMKFQQFFYKIIPIQLLFCSCFPLSLTIYHFFLFICIFIIDQQCVAVVWHLSSPSSKIGQFLSCVLYYFIFFFVCAWIEC